MSDSHRFQDSLVASIRQAGRALAAAGGVLGGLLIVATVLTSAHPWIESAIVAGAGGVLLGATWWVLAQASKRPEMMVAWVGAAYLVKVVTLGAALIGSRSAGLDQRWVGLWLIIVVLVCMAIEVWVLSRTRLSAVDPTAG